MCMICLLVVQPIFMAFDLTQDSIIQIAGAAVVVAAATAAAAAAADGNLLLFQTIGS